MALTPFRVPAGTPVYVGAPANPMSLEYSTLIGAAASRTRGILEAHLPQCFAPPALAEPEQVLVVLVNPGPEANQILDALALELSRALPKDFKLAMWPMTEQSAVLPTVREANCRVR